VGTNRALKATALAEVNRGIRQWALEDSTDEDWEFFCECGEADCVERVALTLEAYDLLQGQRSAVLARAHHQIERAIRLGDEAQALVNQAQQQVKRAARNQRAGQEQPRQEDA
jgi:hypothetical protein